MFYNSFWLFLYSRQFVCPKIIKTHLFRLWQSYAIAAKNCKSLNHEISTKKSFGPTKSSRVKILNPWNTHRKKFCDLWYTQKKASCHVSNRLMRLMITCDPQNLAHSKANYLIFRFVESLFQQNRTSKAFVLANWWKSASSFWIQDLTK